MSSLRQSLTLLTIKNKRMWNWFIIMRKDVKNRWKIITLRYRTEFQRLRNLQTRMKAVEKVVTEEKKSR
ncbi:hypothetical protein LOK49_Contig70G00008 [Camellia lanceoleosa]|nr:hypothetical protein LOK49_Contig70G00008 [Camellia lanceoleosa]